MRTVMHLPEVTVTARHREESLQDVPLSVQAISGQTLELENTVTLSDITAQTPGLFDHGTTLRYIANAGNVRSRGLEWDLAAALGGGARLDFDGAWNDAIFPWAPSVAPPPEVTTPSYDATGKAAADAPKVTLSLTPSWNYKIGGHESFYTYAQYSFSSSFYSATNLSAYGVVPNQFNLNLRAGLQLNDGKCDTSRSTPTTLPIRETFTRAGCCRYRQRRFDLQNPSRLLRRLLTGSL